MIGHFYCDELRFADLKAMKDTIAQSFHVPQTIMVKGKERKNPEYLSPVTANGWLSILRVICAEMTAEFELRRNPTEELKDFDTSEVSTTQTKSRIDSSPNRSRHFSI